MDRINAPLERRDFRDQSEAEHYVALARGFKDVDEFRAFRAARETRSNDIRSFERRMAVLECE
jgi:hypothetical protein